MSRMNGMRGQPEVINMRCQPAQARFLSSPADIAIGGGANGGGKSWALLFEPLRHIKRPGFTACVFRRTCPEITAPDGLWTEAYKGYRYLVNQKPNRSEMTWTFPSGALIKFGHLQYEDDVYNYKSSQIALLEFDQVESFTEKQFFYMLTRNRSICGVRPYVRATASPEDNWLLHFLDWWIGEDGYPILERSGKLRWLLRRDDQSYWADSWAELHTKYSDWVAPPNVSPDGIREKRAQPSSVTFVPFKLDDNAVLCRSDPAYRAKLEAAPHIEKMRLLYGNWRVSSAKGEWPAEWFETVKVEMVPSTDFLCSVVAVDPSKGRQDRFGDWCSIVNLKIDRHLVLWVSCWMGRWPSTELLEECLRICKQCGLPPVFFEINQYQELLASDLHRLCIARGIIPRIYGITNTEPKPIRIRRLGPFLAQKRLKILATPGGDLLLGQMRTFGPKDPSLFDDGPDSLEMAVRGMEFLMYGPDAVQGTLPQALEGTPMAMSPNERTSSAYSYF